MYTFSGSLLGDLVVHVGPFVMLLAGLNAALAWAIFYLFRGIQEMQAEARRRSALVVAETVTYAEGEWLFADGVQDDALIPSGAADRPENLEGSVPEPALA